MECQANPGRQSLTRVSVDRIISQVKVLSHQVLRFSVELKCPPVVSRARLDLARDCQQAARAAHCCYRCTGH